MTTAYQRPVEPDVSPRHRGITWSAIAAELDREAALRARVYPDQVARGRLNQADADRELALVAAWRADCAAMIAHSAAPPCDFTWADKRAGLARELERRARIYPGLIDTARLGTADAGRQVAALACFRLQYDEGFGWPAAPELRAALTWRFWIERGTVEPAAANAPDWIRRDSAAALAVALPSAWAMPAMQPGLALERA